MATTRGTRKKDDPPPIPTHQRPQTMVWCITCAHNGKLDCDLQVNQPCSRCVDYNHEHPSNQQVCTPAVDQEWPTGWPQWACEKKLRKASWDDHLPRGVFPDNTNGRFLPSGGQQPSAQRPNQQRPRAPARPQDYQDQQRHRAPPQPQTNAQQQFTNPYPLQYQPATPYGSYAPQPSFDPRYPPYGVGPPSAFDDRWLREERTREDRERREEREHRDAADRREARERLSMILAAGVRNLPTPVVSPELHGQSSTLLDQRGRLLVGQNTPHLTNYHRDTAQQQFAKNSNNKRQREEDEHDEIQSPPHREPSVPRGRRCRRSGSNANQNPFDKSTFFQNGRPAAKQQKKNAHGMNTDNHLESSALDPREAMPPSAAQPRQLRGNHRGGSSSRAPVRAFDLVRDQVPEPAFDPYEFAPNGTLPRGTFPPFDNSDGGDSKPARDGDPNDF